MLNDSGELEAECIGNRLNAGKGKGVQILVDYRLVANDFYVGRLKRKLSKEEFLMIPTSVSLSFEDV